MSQSRIIIYQAETGEIELDVRLDNNTVWLTQKQLSELLQVSIPTINEHIRNIFAEDELESRTTIRKFRIVQNEGSRKVNRNIDHYNLDMILSVGYRVKSAIATKFRQWATQTLRLHLVNGYTLNQQRLENMSVDMEYLMDLVEKTLKKHHLAESGGIQLARLIGDYARSWTMLLAYDENTLPELDKDKDKDFPQSLTEKECLSAIPQLKHELMNKGEASDLFGRIRGNGLASSLGAIEQTFDDQPLYPTTLSRAAHLLYFIIKNHPFTDGNKRIGSFLFLVYLEKNHAGFKPNGERRISDNTLVPLSLLTAESQPKQKDLIIRLVQHLIN